MYIYVYINISDPRTPFLGYIKRKVQSYSGAAVSNYEWRYKSLYMYKYMYEFKYVYIYIDLTIHIIRRPRQRGSSKLLQSHGVRLCVGEFIHICILYIYIYM